MNPKIATRRATLLLLLFTLCASAVVAQTSVFTYQGRLTDGGTAANGNYDLQFALFDTASGGAQIATQTSPNVSVSAGIFTVQLDFGANAFPGTIRFLEISARLSGAASFTTLSPRQQITSTPYAIRSLNASSADAVTVNGLPSGSGNYIQNATALQAGANFNISGNGTAGGTLSANTVNATTQYNIGGSHALSIGNSSVFVGPFAPVNKNIPGNTFVGSGAGFNNSAGDNNSFFGSGAGQQNTGGRNAFFGSLTGQFNTTGTFNSFFGMGAGRNNFNSSTGDANSFFGYFAGKGNLSGSNNTAIGREATFGSGNLTFATAIGAFAQVDQSNSLVLGSIAGVNGATASVNVGIGTPAPLSKLDIAATGDGAELLRFSTERPWVFRQVRTGPSTGLQLRSTSGIKMFEITALGGANVATFVADDASPRVGIGTTDPPATLTVKGPGPIDLLRVENSSGLSGLVVRNDRIVAIGLLSSLEDASTHVCVDSVRRLSFCSSSLRYKQQVAPYSAGLDLIRRLRPISFTWKGNGTRDLGLGAEDVVKVEPLLVTHNDKGEIQGVKYDQLNVVLINAIKQQQTQIETLRAENTALNVRLGTVERALRKRVGSSRRRR